MQELASRISSMWVPWGEVAWPCDDLRGRLADAIAGGRQVTLRAPGDPAVADQAAARFLDMVRVEEPDWGDDRAVEEICPEIPVPKSLPRPPAQRQGCVRLGVGLGGVLLAKTPSGQLPTVRTASDIGIKMGYSMCLALLSGSRTASSSMGQRMSGW